MTHRERYTKALLFQNPDKIPFEPGGPRKSTLERWHKEGLPKNANWLEYVCETIGVKLSVIDHVPLTLPVFCMIPRFEEKILEHKNGHYIIQDWMGSVLEISDKYDYTYIRDAIDFVTRRWIKCPVETRDDWAEMKRRYNAQDPERIKLHSSEEVKIINQRNSYKGISINGPFWQLREWLGFEGLCIAMLEDPDFVAEMIEFWQDYIQELLSRFLKQGIVLDYIQIFEDMAYKGRSMISPAMTREFILPVYKKWIRLCAENGIKIFDLDSDGYVGELIPLWIEGGINVCDPIEVAAYNDIIQYSRLYGEKMAYKGGVDKRAIAAGGMTIENELKRLAPLMSGKGGFIPSCDHGVPNDISLENYVYYAKLLAKYTGWL